MLHAILHEIQTASGPVTVQTLSRKLGVQPGALTGMLQFWVQKGRLQLDDGAGGLTTMTVCAQTHCRGRCPGPAQCPFIQKQPTTYSLTRKTP